ncbi:hypothetical protein HWV62_36041, partial [Athelia sp. TMB]
MSPGCVEKKYIKRANRQSSTASAPLNRDKWKPFENDVTPSPCIPWYATLGFVNRAARLHGDLDKAAAGYRFPNPGMLAAFDPEKRAQAVTLWLTIR